MNRLSMLFIIFLFFGTSGTIQASSATNSAIQPIANADWLIVGAGPASIATLGVLLDIGVSSNRIIWIDPSFNVGRLGEYFNNVPGNNKNADFVRFINSCKVFQEFSCPAIELLKNIDPNEYQTLSIIIEPLRHLTGYLRTKVKSIKSCMTALFFEHDMWYIRTSSGALVSSNHVILATGSHPKTLNYEKNKVIPLDIALDPHNLAQLIAPDDVVGVVGSAHSAILLLKFLSTMPVKHVYNFYKTPLQYAIDMGGWLSNPFTGLRGSTAEWAQNVLEKNPPENLTRMFSSPETLSSMLPQCTKVIYALGFERNHLPLINGSTPITTYNETNGFIAPRLFGIGIAFPELSYDKLGNPGHRIGLESFMNYAQRLIPQWVNEEIFKQARIQANKQLDIFQKMSELFAIYTL